MRGERVREALTAYLFIAPNLAVFAVFMFLPLVMTFYIAMQQKPTFGPAHWVGFENYRTLISDHTFWRAVFNTTGYAIVMVPLSLGLGLGLALLLNRKMWLRALFRSIYFVPVVISGLASGIIAGWLFNEEVGVANKIAGYVGLGPFHWQSRPALAVVTVILITLWGRLGFCMIVYLSALQGVPQEYYDAASVDGATKLQQLRHITIPGIRYATAFLIVMGIIESFQVFDLVYALTGGGPGDTTNVLGLYAYTTAFQSRNQGYGAAVGVALYLIIIIVTVAQWRVTNSDQET